MKRKYYIFNYPIKMDSNGEIIKMFDKKVELIFSTDSIFVALKDVERNPEFEITETLRGEFNNFGIHQNGSFSYSGVGTDEDNKEIHWEICISVLDNIFDISLENFVECIDV